MFKPTAAVAAALLLSACDGTSLPKPLDARTIGYSFDARTTLCFASTSSITKDGWKVVSIANVPCTPAVSRLVP